MNSLAHGKLVDQLQLQNKILPNQRFKIVSIHYCLQVCKPIVQLWSLLESIVHDSLISNGLGLALLILAELSHMFRSRLSVGWTRCHQLEQLGSAPCDLPFSRRPTQACPQGGGRSPRK